jgi:hypothetical protein
MQYPTDGLYSSRSARRVPNLTNTPKREKRRGVECKQIVLIIAYLIEWSLCLDSDADNDADNDGYSARGGNQNIVA